MTLKRSLGAALLYTTLISTSCAQMEERNATSAQRNPADLASTIIDSHAIELRQRPLKMGNEYNIYVEGQKVGEIKENIFSWGDHFDIYAGDSTLKIGSAQQKLLSWGYETQVLDGNGQAVGTLNEKIFKWKPGHQIEIQDRYGRTLTTAEQRLLTFAFKADLYGPNKETHGKSERDFIWSNYRTSLTESAPDIDGRLLAMLCVAEDKMQQRDAEDDSDDDDDDDD